MKNTFCAAALYLMAIPALASLPTQKVQLVYDGSNNQFYAKEPGTHVAFAVQAMNEESAEYLASLRQKVANRQHNTCQARGEFVHSTAPTMNVWSISCEHLRLTTSN
jgi:hypothetical protein